jgi:hypothetical protein
LEEKRVDLSPEKALVHPRRVEVVRFCARGRKQFELPHPAEVPVQFPPGREHDDQYPATLEPVDNPIVLADPPNPKLIRRDPETLKALDDLPAGEWVGGEFALDHVEEGVAEIRSNG